MTPYDRSLLMLKDAVRSQEMWPSVRTLRKHVCVVVQPVHVELPKSVVKGFDRLFDTLGKAFDSRERER